MDKIRKSKAIVRIEFSDTTAYQKILAEYLKNSGEAKAIVYSDVSSLKMARALALATDPKISLQELECVARKNRREILNHVSDLDDFFMLNYQIDLQSDRPQSDPIKKSPSPSSSIKKTKDEQEDQEDQDDYSDLDDDEYMAIMQSRITNPEVK